MLRNDLYIPWFGETEEWGVEIVDGEFAGVVVKFNNLNISKSDKGGVDVDLDIIKQPEDRKEVDTENPLFNHTIELIINDILKEAIEIYEQTRTDNTEEPSS